MAVIILFFGCFFMYKDSCHCLYFIGQMMEKRNFQEQSIEHINCLII